MVTDREIAVARASRDLLEAPRALPHMATQGTIVQRIVMCRHTGHNRVNQGQQNPRSAEKRLSFTDLGITVPHSGPGVGVGGTPPTSAPFPSSVASHTPRPT